MRWDGPVFSGLSEKKSDFVTCQTGPPGGLAPLPGVPGGASGPCWGGAWGVPGGHAAAHPPPPASTGGFAVDSFPMIPGLGQAVETVWRWYTRAPGMLGARSRQPGAERPHVIHPPPRYISGPTCADIYICTPTPCLPIYIPLPSSQPTRDRPGGLDPAPCLPAGPLSSPPHPRPDVAAMPPGDAPHPSAPTGQPPLLRDAQHPVADWSILLLRDAQHPVADWSILPRDVADWSIPPALLHLPPLPVCCLRSPPPAPHQGHPANWRTLLPPAGAPLEGEPLWHHRATRGLPGVGYPPGARPSTTPARAGVVHNRPRDTPCRRRAPALTLHAGQHPAVPAAHPPPVRERRAPCPVRLAQSCLSTYPPTPFGSQVVKVV